MAKSVLERIAAGDESAVTECMDEFRGLVFSLARRFTQSAADAEDASQEIFLEIWKSAARFDPKRGTEAAFVSTIARRRLIDRLRAARRQPPTEQFDEMRASSAEPEPADAVAAAVEIDAAQSALARLEPGQREVLLLGIVEGLTHTEIATRTGRPLGTVKTQMRRGLIRVRKLLAADGG